MTGIQQITLELARTTPWTKALIAKMDLYR